jgi:uncharacterized DUF497 family protein
MGLTFEWDEEKDLSNEKKHGVSFDEAKTFSMTRVRLRSQMNNTRMRKIGTSTSAFRRKDG